MPTALAGSGSTTQRPLISCKRQREASQRLLLGCFMHANTGQDWPRTLPLLLLLPLSSLLNAPGLPPHQRRLPP